MYPFCASSPEKIGKTKGAGSVNIRMSAQKRALETAVSWLRISRVAAHKAIITNVRSATVANAALMLALLNTSW